MPQPAPEPAADLQVTTPDDVVSNVLHSRLTTQIYLQCAAMPSFRIQDLDTPEDATVDETEAVLGILAARGLVSRLHDDVWVTNPPDQALADQAARLEEHAITIRAAAPGLARVYYQAQARHRAGSYDQGVQLLETLDDVNTAMAELFAGARENVYSMRTRSPRVEMMLRQDPDRAAAPILNSAGNRLHFRVTFDTDLLAVDGMPTAIEQRLAVDEIRFASTVPFTATTSDVGFTVMDLPSTDGGAMGVRVTHPDVSSAIRAVIDNNWVQGMKATAVKTDLKRPAPLDRRDTEILRLMVGGATDATIARGIGISQRTVERRVRRILELLGAKNRFQAGALAARRGWT